MGSSEGSVGSGEDSGCQGTNNQSNIMVCLASVMVTLYPT